MVAEFRRRRDAFCDGLNELPGFRCAIPGGAFYAFANVEGTGLDSKDLADSLLTKPACPAWTAAASAITARGTSASATPIPWNLMEAVARIKKFSPKWAQAAAK